MIAGCKGWDEVVGSAGMDNSMLCQLLVAMKASGLMHVQ